MRQMKVIRYHGSYRRWEQAQKRKRVIITLTALALSVGLVLGAVFAVRGYVRGDFDARAKGDSMSYEMHDGEVVELSVLAGERGVLSLPDDVSVSDAVFVSSAPDIVRVDDGGRMDALARGKATVTVTSGAFRSSCELSVGRQVEVTRPDEITTAYTANEDVVEANRQNGTDDLYFIVVNRRTNTVTVYTYNEGHHYKHAVRAMVCSCGTGGDDITPVGKYALYFKERWHPLYGDVFGQYVCGFEGPYLFHSVPYYTEDPGDLETAEYNNLSDNASQGCVRLSVSDTKWIYDNCPLNTPVRVIDAGPEKDPLGTPPTVRIDEKIKWDPTDPDERNPYHDRVPVITAADITLKAGGQPDLLKGVTAADICGNDISDRVQVDGTVYTDKPGTYYVTYTVEDDFRLHGEATVAVTVEP